MVQMQEGQGKKVQVHEKAERPGKDCVCVCLCVNEGGRRVLWV